MKKNVLKIASLILAGTFVLTACNKDDNPKPSGAYSNATFVVCEGNYQTNDGAIDAIVDGKVESDIFDAVNNRPFGDIVQSMSIIDGKAYIVVNNSGKVEVVDAKTFKSEGVCSGFSYPQAVANRNEDEIFVSNGNGYGNDYVYVVNKLSLQKTDSVATGGKGPNSMIVANGKLFVANYGGYLTDNTISVIDVEDLTVEKTIEVGDMPSDMELDNDGNIIVVCKGASVYNEDWTVILSSTNSEIIKINSSSYDVSTIMEFDHQLASYGANLISYNGKIYFIDNGVYSIDNNTATKLIEGDFYGLDVNPKNGDIWTTSTPSLGLHFVSQYDKDGNFIQKYTVGNFPKAVIFQ